MDEDALEGGQAGGPGDGPGTASFTGQLNIRWGADRGDILDAQGILDGAKPGSTNNADLTGRAVYFSSADVGVVSTTEDATEQEGGEEPITQALSVPVLTSRGHEVHFRLDDSGTKIIGYVGIWNQDDGEEEEALTSSQVGDTEYHEVLFATLSDDGSGS